MIKLFTIGPAFGLPDPSPFVNKVDFYLKLTGVEYQTVSRANNLQKAPKGKVPFIEDNGEKIGDSTFIIEHLKQNHNADLDQWLTPEQTATAQLITKSLDENLYWTIGHARWVQEECWPHLYGHFFSKLPFPINKIVAKIARSSFKKAIIGHGMGRHTDQEVIHIAETTLHSLSILLGDKDYFFGDQPCTLDVTAYAMIAGLTSVNFDSAITKMARKYTNLVSFVDRITAQHYPEFVT